MLFIFHVSFPIPVPISPTLPISITYSLYRLNIPGDKMQSYLTPFWIWNHSVVPWSSCTVAIYYVCRSRINTVKCSVIPTFVMLFHIFKCSTVSKSLVYSVKQIDIFVVLPCAVHDSLTLAVCSLAPRRFLNPDFSTGVLYTLYESSFLYNSQEDHIFMKK